MKKAFTKEIFSQTELMNSIFEEQTEKLLLLKRYDESVNTGKILSRSTKQSVSYTHLTLPTIYSV